LKRHDRRIVKGDGESPPARGRGLKLKQAAATLCPIRRPPRGGVD